MVVDDEPAIGKLLLYQLRGFGYEASYVQNGLLALQHFILENPDVVLLDVMMPMISGWELCRQLRACSSVPVIMLTAKSADADIVSGLGAGADDYLTKPFSMVQLQARIEAVLRRTQPARGDHRHTRARARRDPHLAMPSEVYSARAPAQLLDAAPPQREASAAPAPNQAAQSQPAPLPRRLGQQVREARLSRGLSLHQVERVCKIRWEFLQAIEQENWSYVPRAQLRIALRAYTSYLGLDLGELLGRPKVVAQPPLFPLHLAAFMAVLVLLLVVGLYLFRLA
jgi:DNA-binding response OmpR family regulator/transcriptional regulator with XRE-family HTH domain